MKSGLVLAGIGAFVAGAAAYAVFGGYNVAADDPHWKLTEELFESVRERSIEKRASDVVVPRLDDESDIRAGAGNYDAMCADCHQRPGAEESALRKGLNPPPPDLTGFAADPAEAFWVIRHGIKMTGMPAWAGHADEKTTWQIVALLQKLPELKQDEYRELVESSGGHQHGGPEGEVPAAGPTGDEVQVHAGGEPAAVVDRFYAALSTGDLAAVKAFLDPQALVLESGGAEHSAAEYLGHHAREDADFLRGSRYRVARRTARVDGDLAWVGSEGALSATQDGKPLELATSETMVLKKADDGWKIVHIHWSSLVRKPAAAHQP